MDTPINPEELRQWQRTQRKRRTLSLISGFLLIQPTAIASFCFITLLIPSTAPNDNRLLLPPLKPVNHTDTSVFMSLTQTLNDASLFSNEKSALICLILLILRDKIKALLPNNNEEHLYSAGLFLVTLLNAYLKFSLFTVSHSHNPFSFYHRVKLIVTSTLSLSLLIIMSSALIDTYEYQEDKPKGFSYTSIFTDYEKISNKIPDDVSLCPLVKQFNHTLELLNPHIVRAMIAPDGITYDFDNLTKWFDHMKQDHQTIASPITGNTMLLSTDSLLSMLYPNRALQGILDGDPHVHCPISFEPFDHAITDLHGHSYNERSLQYWFFKSKQRTCPLVPDHEIGHNGLRPNYTLKKYEDMQRLSTPAL